MDRSTDIPLTLVKPREDNPAERTEDIEGLIESIRSCGLMQPIVVRSISTVKNVHGHYQIVAGHRRFAAFQKLFEQEGDKWERIPAMVVEADDELAEDMTLTENLQRRDLSLREAMGLFQSYAGKRENLETLALRCGMPMDQIKILMKLSELGEEVFELYEQGRISKGAIEVILSAPLGNVRETIISIACRDATYRTVSAGDMRFQLGRLVCELSTALFKKTDCKTCPDNSGRQRSLFGDDKTRCTNPKCFMEKQTAAIIKSYEKNPKEGTTGCLVGDQPMGVATSLYSIHTNCKDCEHRKAHYRIDGSLDNSDLCTNPNCYAKIKQHKKPEATEQEKAQALEARTPIPRVEWHGEAFRELFFKEQFPVQMLNLMLNKENEHNVNTGLVVQALALIMNSPDIHAAIAERFHIIFKVEVPEDQKRWWHFKFDQLFTALDGLEGDTLKCLIREVAGMSLFTKAFIAEQRFDLAEYMGIELEKEWVLHREYLEKKTKQEILDLCSIYKLQFEGVVDPNAVLPKMKKPELITLILEKCRQDLTGVVPWEIMRPYKERHQEIFLERYQEAVRFKKSEAIHSLAEMLSPSGETNLLPETEKELREAV